MSRTIALPVLIIFLAILDARASADDDVGVNVRFYGSAHKQAAMIADAVVGASRGRPGIVRHDHTRSVGDRRPCTV